MQSVSASKIKQDYQDKDVARNYDRDRFRGPVGSMFNNLERATILRVVDKVCEIIPHPLVLDIPCGTGRITEVLLEKGLAVTGGDVAVEMIDVARERCARYGERVNWQRLDLEGLALPDKSYDLVTCIRLFHHVDTNVRERFLCELARVSRRFVLINVSFSSPYYKFRRRLKRALRQAVSRTSSSRSDIAREAGAAGLRLVHSRYVLPYVSEDRILLFEKD